MNIKFDEFKRFMENIVAFEEIGDKLSAATSDYNKKTKDYADLSIPSTTFDTVTLLERVTNDTSSWISYWVYELDCGRKYKNRMITESDGTIIKLATIEDLWKLLKSEERLMNCSEITQDLFTVPQGFYLAHCISGDYALGAGIAKKFNEIYNMRFKLHKNYPIPDGEKFDNVGRALLIDNVFNLVTKNRYFEKPTYDTLRETLEDMKYQCDDLDINKLAMPRIAAGLDRLDWEQVKEIIDEVFEDTDIQVVICSL